MTGNLTAQRDGRNQWLYFEYDALDRLAKKRQDSANGPLLAEYLFDAAGQKGLLSRSKAYTAQGTVEIFNVTYDARNRLTQQNWIVPGAGGGAFRLDHTYNAADQPATLRYPGGTAGQQGELVTTGYNGLGQLNSVSGSGVSYVSSTTYNTRGQVTEQRLDTGSNGLTRQYVYDSNTMRLTTLRAGVSSPYTNLQNLSYTYDAAGNVASIVDGVNSSQRQCFGYDALDRLTAAFTGNAGCTAYTTGGTGPYNHTYVYDTIGNLTSYAGNTYTYGDSAHKHAVTNAYGNAYAYDGNGNQTTRTIGGVAYTFIFDYENRLTEVKQGTTSLATFLYDADGNRVKGTVSGVTTAYIAGIYEYQAGATTKYYEGGGLRRTGYSTNNGVFYMLSDHLKSTSALVARNGVLNVKYFYFAYGARRGVPFNTITAKHFTGQYHETALPGGEGLSFYNSRWYDPKLGRFLSADTIVPNASDPQALNRYTYVLGNPLKFIDPTGHRNECGATTGGGCGGGSGTTTWTPSPPVYGPAPRPASTSTPKPTHQSPSVPATTQAPTQQTSEPPWGPSQSPDDDWVDLGFDWLLQHGEDTRHFTESDYMVDELKRHRGVVAARQAALVVDYPPGVPFHYQHDFGPDGYVLAWKEMDGIGHFLGTYDVFITDSGGGTATVRVENQSDWASFTNLRSFPVDISLVEVLAANQKPFIDGKPQFRTILPDIPRNQTFGYGGNYLQIYEWQEPWP